VDLSNAIERLALMFTQARRGISSRILQNVHMDPVCLGTDQYVSAYSVLIRYTWRSVKGVGYRTVK
jgi:hypothetical protein